MGNKRTLSTVDRWRSREYATKWPPAQAQTRCLRAVQLTHQTDRQRRFLRLSLDVQVIKRTHVQVRVNGDNWGAEACKLGQQLKTCRGKFTTAFLKHRSASLVDACARGQTACNRGTLLLDRPPSNHTCALISELVLSVPEQDRGLSLPSTAQIPRSLLLRLDTL